MEISRGRCMQEELKNCPFCGKGETRIDETKHWTGMRSQVLSVVLRHWCETGEGLYRRYIEFTAKDHKRVTEMWNSRNCT